eukprot:5844627-Prymnesium_polylepis.1
MVASVEDIKSAEVASKTDHDNELAMAFAADLTKAVDSAREWIERPSAATAAASGGRPELGEMLRIVARPGGRQHSNAGRISQ